MNSTITVLMYHAVCDTRGECMGADVHYTVTSRQFDSHLALAVQAGLRLRSLAHLLAIPADRPRSVAFTFDDGHVMAGAAQPEGERRAGDAGAGDQDGKFLVGHGCTSLRFDAAHIHVYNTLV